MKVIAKMQKTILCEVRLGSVSKTPLTQKMTIKNERRPIHFLGCIVINGGGETQMFEQDNRIRAQFTQMINGYHFVQK